MLTSFPQIQIIQNIARRRKVSIYLVGGFLRDALLGRPNCDLDFAVEKGGLKIARAFANKIKGSYVILDKDRGCARVVKKIKDRILTFDFADFRAKTIQADLGHRDFTINALAVNLGDCNGKTLLSEVLMDVKGAQKDLREKRICQVSAQSFKDDPLRMLRAFSLRAMLEFQIEKKTLQRIKKDQELLREVSYERIRDELFKILETDHAASILKEMDRVGLLEKVIPQIRVMYRCPQGGYHHLDVWRHSLETVVQMEKVLKTFKGHAAVTDDVNEKLAGQRSRRALMKLAALLHDIGKPETKRVENGRTSFHGHEHVGKNIVRHIAKMLKLSTLERHTLEDMVELHLRPGYLSNFKQPSQRAIYRYFRDARREGSSVLLLSLADQYATRGPLTTKRDLEHHEKICLGLIKQHFERKEEKPRPKLLTGHDLIKKMKLKPSPLFGKILKAVAEQQALGKIKTKQEALEFAKGRI